MKRRESRVKEFKRSILDSYSNKSDMKKHKYRKFSTWYLVMLSNTNCRCNENYFYICIGIWVYTKMFMGKHVTVMQGRENDGENMCLVAHACLILCNPVDCSLSGSSVHGTFQVRIPEWLTYFLLQGIFLTQGLNISCISYIGKQILYH